MFKKIVTIAFAASSAIVLTFGGQASASTHNEQLAEPSNAPTVATQTGAGIPFTFRFDSPNIRGHKDYTMIYASPSFTKSNDPVTLQALDASRRSARDKNKSIRILNADYPAAFGYRLYNDMGLTWSGETIAHSMTTGENNVLNLVMQTTKNDPTSKIILSGYSQGSLIAANVLTAIGNGKHTNIPQNKIYKTILIADPDRSSGQAGINEPGLLGGRKDWGGQKNKVVSICNYEDIYCHGPEGWTDWFGKTNAQLVYKDSSFFNALGLALSPHKYPLYTLDSGRLVWGLSVHMSYNLFPDLVPEFYNIIS